MVKFLPLTVLILSLASAPAADRDVQITTIDFETSVLTLENLGAGSEPLDGWRFCSHDDNQVRRYSSGISGKTLEPGGVLHVHFLNDVPAGDDERINLSTVGGSFATPLDREPYGIQIYSTPVSFGNGNTIADHLQWSIGGADDASADDRSDEAQAGGVWVDQSQWISTAADSTKILLGDLTGTVLHQPSDYDVLSPPVDPSPFELDSIDIAANGDVTITWALEADVSYEVMRSEDLVNFTPLGTTSSGAFMDTEAPADRAFYMVVGTFSR